MPPIEGGSPPPDTGTERAVERTYSRAEIREALKKSAEVYKKSILEDPHLHTMPESERQKKFIEHAYVRNAVDSVMTWRKKDKDTHEQVFANHDNSKLFTQQEGAPVELMIKSLSEQIAKEKNSKRREKLAQYKDILESNSKSYEELHGNSTPEEKEKYQARLKWEAYLISGDARNTGSPDGNWFLAEQTIRNRRELRYPPIAGGADDEIVDPPPPITDPPDADDPPLDTPPTPPVDTAVDDDTVHEVVIANRDRDAWKNARELAQKLIAKEQRAGSIFNPLTWGRKLGLKRIEMFWEQKLTRQIHTASIQSGNAYVNVDMAASSIRIGDLFRNEVRNLRIDTTTRAGSNSEAARAAVESLKTQHREGIDASGAEVLPGNRNDLIEVNGPIRDRVIAELLRPAIRGEISPLLGRRIETAADVQEVLRSFADANQNDPQIRQLFGEGNIYGEGSKLFATDLLEMAGSLRAHGYATKEIDEKVKILLANPEWAGNSEATFNEVDNFIRWAQERKLRGAILNPTVVSIGMSLGLAGLQSAARKMSTAGVAVGVGTFIASPLIAPLAGVAVGALWAAAERNTNLKKDRARHQRERGYGDQMPAPGEAPRREALDQYQYFTATSDHLLNGFRDPATQTKNSREMTELLREHPISGRDLLVGDDRKGIRELMGADLSNLDNRQAVIRRVAEIRARLDHSKQNVDLIQFEDKTQVEQGRLGLIVAMVEARRALTASGMTTAEIKSMENQLVGQWNVRFAGDRTDQDQQFAHYRLRQSLIAGAVGGAIGLVTAEVTQEVSTQIARHSPTMDNMPVIGSIINSGRTIRENIVDGKPFSEWNLGGHNPDQIDYAQTQELVRSQGSSLEIRPGVFLEHASDNSYHLKDSAGAELYSGGIRVEDNGNIVISTTENSASLPPSIKELMEQPGVLVHERDLPWNGAELYAKGGMQELGQNIALRVTVDSANNRIVDLVDLTSNTVVASPPLRLEPDGRFVIEQGFDKLPDNLKLLFGQTGWSHAPTDGLNNPDFNIDKAKDFANNAVARGGRLGLNNTVDWAIDPEAKNHLGEADNAISFTDKAVNGSKGVDSHPGWINKDGSFVFAGEKAHMSAEAQTFLGTMEAKETTEHNLKYYMAELAKGGVDKARHEVIQQGNFTIDTHDLHTGDLNMDVQLDANGKPVLGSDGQPIPLHLPYDEWAKRGGFDAVGNRVPRIDPITHQTEVGKMSFAYKAETPDEIWVNGFLQQDGKIHVDPAYFVDNNYQGNKVISPEQWEKVFGEMGKEGWTVDKTAEGQYIITPPTATAYTPPTFEAIDPPVKGSEIVLVAPPEQSPALPIIDAPRFPLEALAPFPGLPDTPRNEYYSGETLTESRKWLSENPQAHKPVRKVKHADGTESWIDKDGNPVKRDISRERTQISEFMTALQAEDPAHYAELLRLAPLITPMNNETRVAVNIPSWMEGKTIYETLDKYTKQVDKDGNPIDPNLYEINIIVNRKTGSTADNTVAEIERFKASAATRGQNLQINYIDVEFDAPLNNVGNARRVITNLTLLRSLQRSTQTGQLYIESEDADLISIDQKTVTNIIEKLDENPQLDAVRGIQDRAPEKMMENDFLFLYRRMQDFKEVFLRRKDYRPENNPRGSFNWNRTITGGWNTAYTAEAYALIGGYNPYMSKGEDMLIGERLSMARGDGLNPNTEIVGRVNTRSDSSPRRYIYEVATGQAAYGENFEDPAVNALIRNKTPEELMESIENLSRIDSANTNLFASMVNNEYQFILGTTPTEADAQDVTKQVMLWLGFKPGDYEFGPSHNLIVNNWSNVSTALNGYRERHTRPRADGERIRNEATVGTPPLPRPRSIFPRFRNGLRRRMSRP